LFLRKQAERKKQTSFNGFLLLPGKTSIYSVDLNFIGSKTVSVKLTISHPEDVEILEKKGIHALRQHKMMRFAAEAYNQGGLLVQEDLALLLNSGRRTIQACRGKLIFASW
jgi:hypothetical protein